MNIISVYLGHNASISVSKDGVILEVLELERLLNVKNAGAILQLGSKNPKQTLTLAKSYLMKKYNISWFDLLLLNQYDMKTLLGSYNPNVKYFNTENEVVRFFSANKFELVHHQHGHMACAFYQSTLQKVRGCSFDGGGSDGNFNVFECDRQTGIKQIAYIPNHTIGMRYSEFGQYTTSIKRDRTFWEDGGLVYPGKLMGLASYGKVREEWLPAFEKFYTGTYTNDLNANYKVLKEELNLPDEFTGEFEADVVATSQKMFEHKFDTLVRPYFEGEENFILTGGCALNILNNEKLQNELNVFVPPNPHDGGLSLGFLLDYIKPENAFDGTYMGPDAWDAHTLAEIVEKYNGNLLDKKELINDLVSGKIVGVVRGGSELGPRALGNRSILCHAAVHGMKDILNKKVKNREWYRPFAPMCREEDASTFFEIKNPSVYRWMSFCPKVKEQHRKNLESITHVDGTARLQTVTSTQNEWLYELLTMLAEKSSYPVLLNTSFNIAGKPILNTYRDAVWMLENTQMDGLILENYYIRKRG